MFVPDIAAVAPIAGSAPHLERGQFTDAGMSLMLRAAKRGICGQLAPLQLLGSQRAASDSNEEGSIFTSVRRTSS
jgi:hypothetical protein